MGKTNMVRWRSLHVVAQRVFDEPFRLAGEDVPHAWHPPTDVFECDDVYVIRMDIGGLPRDAKGDVAQAEVVTESDEVIVRGMREDRCPFRKCGYYQMEIPYGPFEFRVRIREPFDHSHITAVYRDGFLEISIPKAQSHKPGTHRIEVRG